MADSVLNNKKWFQQSHVYTFTLFCIILLTVIFLILISSINFYKSMVENITAFSLQNSCQRLSELDLDSSDLIDNIHQLEKNDGVIVNIANKSQKYRESYGDVIYEKTENFAINGIPGAKKDTSVLSFNYERFLLTGDDTPLKTLNQNTHAGKYINPETGKAYFVLSIASGDSLFVVGKPFDYISAQANAVKLAAIFISFIIFILVAVMSYLFITRITRPLRDIREVTAAMAETNNSTLRIPTRNTDIMTDTDNTIASVNYLYEQLILTQEGLKEKTEFLAGQLAQRDEERKSREAFIASISHELKTPIAIIQGYAEGTKFVKDDPDAIDEYSDTIIDECVRMNDLIIKMITLSKLQHKKNLVLSDFSIREFIDERLHLHDKVFEKNNITVENLVTDDIIGKADKDKLQFVFNNLVSNAISYIGGERLIRIRYEKVESVYRIFVFNSGDPIPQKDIELLWESFYRNDPARNRDEGHFGLGLSIVKSVQDAHSQACGVENADGGVEFWFDILEA